MKKSTVTGIIFGLLTFIVLYLILTNDTLVFEMFEGRSEYTDPFDDVTVVKTSPVSLSSVMEGKSALTFYGYMKVLLVLLLIPVISGFYVNWRIRKRMRKREQIPSSTSEASQTID